MRVLDVGGAYIQQLETGGLETGTLSVNSNSNFYGDTSITGGLQVGQGLQISGNIGANGQVMLQNLSNSTTALTVANSSGTGLITVDTTADAGNLVTNGSFEQNTTGWSPRGSSTLSQSSANYVVGSKSLDISTTATSNDGAKYPMSFTNGTVYYVSFYEKSGSAATLRIGYSTNNTAAGEVDVAGSLCNGSAASANWTFIMCSFTSTVTASSYFFITQNDTTSRHIYLDAVNLNSTDYIAYREGYVNVAAAFTGNATFRPTQDNSGAFMLQSASGNQYFIGDALNGRVGIGCDTNAPQARLHIKDCGTTTGLQVTVNGDANVVKIEGPGISGQAALSIQNVPLSTGTGDGKAFEIKVSGESFGRAMFYTDGKFGIGGGAGTRDVFLSRFAANQFRISSDGASGNADLLVNHRIGIGTTTPSNQTNSNFILDAQGGDVHLSGDLDMQSDMAVNFNGYYNGTNTTRFGTDAVFSIWQNNNADRLEFNYAASGASGTTTGMTNAFALTADGALLGLGGINALGDQESMVPNAGFEANSDATASVADSWTFAQTVATATASVTAASPGQGDRSQQMAMSAATAEGTFTSGCIPISGGQTYNLSLRLLGSAASTANAMDAFLDTYTSKANCTSSTGVVTVNGVANVTATTTWTGQGSTLAATGATATWARVRIKLGSAAAAVTLTIDGVRLTPSALSVGVDVAENFPALTSDNLLPGEIVSFGSTAPEGGAYATRSTTPYDSKILGVVSTKPGLTLDDGSNYEKVPVALAGRVPVKVNGQNGAIAIGDPITASSTPGVGMKATGAGRIIGTAEEATDGNGDAVITVLIHPGYWAPAISDVLQAQTATFDSMTVNGSANIASLNVSGQTTLANLTVVGNATIEGTLTVKDIVVAGNLTVNGHLLSSSTAPTAAIGSATGQAGTVSIDGTDTAGTLTITVGAQGTEVLTKGELASLTFHTPYEATPRISLTPSNEDSVGLPVYITKTADGFKIILTQAAQNGKTYQFDYLIIGSSVAQP
jgi:hypothetical protein